ncbi:MAG: two-component system response regulator [Candidatus Aenigmatarchaeota archaeon]|nr:MAG: two-component system response regulator [Candidatus Aenigmarchaeota archaeon]
MKTIMVVDDEKDIRETLRLLLEKNGYKVITAENGEDCIKKLKSVKPDLILLDIMMPGLTTKEILDGIESDKSNRNVKIMFVTVVRLAEAEKDDILKRKNIVGYIEKPFDIDNLLKKIKEVLGDQNRSR